MAIMGKVDREQILRDVVAAIEVAKEGGKVGIVGLLPRRHGRLGERPASFRA